MPPKPYYFPTATAMVGFDDSNTEGPSFFLGEKNAFNFSADKMGTNLCGNLQLIGPAGSYSSDKETVSWGLDSNRDMSVSANYRISCGDVSNVSADFTLIQSRPTN